MISRNLVLAFAAGVVAGVVGARLYKQYQGDIDSKINALRSKLQDTTGLGGAAPQAEAAPQPAQAANESEVSLAELEAQKERLEDLIAEQMARQNPHGNA